MARGLCSDEARICAGFNKRAGYRRTVSALTSAGCGKIFLEKASGGRWDRPELHRLLDQSRKGDVIIVSRLDRLSRSLRDLLMIMERIQERDGSD
jgi:DNA invertase Pin-like site-specific DNA recombinase